MDRNQVALHFVGLSALSLSARRAWIEIAIVSIVISCIMSLSARRAWIEIDFAGSAWVPDFPSLSARRAWIEIPQLGR